MLIFEKYGQKTEEITSSPYDNNHVVLGPNDSKVRFTTSPESYNKTYS